MAQAQGFKVEFDKGVPEVFGVGEDEVRGGVGNEPGAGFHFLFELPFAPAGVAVIDPDGAGVGADEAGKLVYLRGEVDPGDDEDLGEGFFGMEGHEGAGAGTALANGVVEDAGAGGVLSGGLDLGPKLLNGKAGGTVDDEAQCAGIRMIDHENDGTNEVTVEQLGGGDEEFSFELAHGEGPGFWKTRVGRGFCKCSAGRKGSFGAPYSGRWLLCLAVQVREKGDDAFAHEHDADGGQEKVDDFAGGIHRLHGDEAENEVAGHHDGKEDEDVGDEGGGSHGQAIFIDHDQAEGHDRGTDDDRGGQGDDAGGLLHGNLAVGVGGGRIDRGLAGDDKVHKGIEEEEDAACDLEIKDLDVQEGEDGAAGDEEGEPDERGRRDGQHDEFFTLLRGAAGRQPEEDRQNARGVHGDEKRDEAEEELVHAGALCEGLPLQLIPNYYVGHDATRFRREDLRTLWKACA